jgi:hypothetical protein
MKLFDTTAFEDAQLGDEGNYYPTPTWVAQELLSHRVALPKDAFVLEPTCGDGRWLDVLPPGTRALGVEMRTDLANIARGKGHAVLCGDVLRVPLPQGLTHAIGNPPFVAEFIDKLLDRLHGLFPKDGLAAFVLPAYYFQTSRHVWELQKRWDIDLELIPRDIYEGLSKTLAFARFTKSTSRRLVGLFLYPEAVDVAESGGNVRKRLREGGWRPVVLEALRECGGEATLQQLYRLIEPRRPTGNPWWQQRVRAVLQTNCRNTDRGRWALPLAA